MAANTTLNEYIKLHDNEGDRTIKNATNAIKNGFVSYCSKVNEEQASDDCEKILNLTALSIKTFANSCYKSSAYLEPSDIEQIKNSLNNYSNNPERINEFKQELVNDLTDFQKQIKARHFERIAEMTKEKQFCDKQIRVLDFEKSKLIMDRLSKIVWPYDEKTQAYDNKIAQLQIKAQQYTKKIENMKKMRPAANEKDILIYSMQLKERFASKI